MISNKIEKKAILVASIIFLLLFLYKFFPYYYFVEENKEILEREFEQSIHRFNNQTVKVTISDCALIVRYDNNVCQYSDAVSNYSKKYDLRYISKIRIKNSFLPEKNLSFATFNFKSSSPREAFQIKYQYCNGKRFDTFGIDDSDVFIDPTEFTGSIIRNINAYIYRNCK
ncbi:hypothetical protein [Roseibium marinum]|uniref:hypothetical protein n=1 Tax=Roseibium marinum TaxID=281252 RepID=UPI0011AEF3D0|nr:hypothetical protein [Roseibium marinum]